MAWESPRLASADGAFGFIAGIRDVFFDVSRGKMSLIVGILRCAVPGPTGSIGRR